MSNKNWENMWNLNYLTEKYKFNVDGICHVGAYKAEEIIKYRELFGNIPVVFIEANIDLENDIINNLKLYDNVRYEICAMGSELGESNIFLHHTENGPGQSSSLLEPKEHLVRYGFPDTSHTRKVNINSLDNIIKDDIVNFLNIDVQGYELKVLQGSKNILIDVDYIITEVNRKEMYKGCPMVEDIDIFLKQYDFIRMELEWWEDKEDWGDALYINKRAIGRNNEIHSNHTNI